MECQPVHPDPNSLNEQMVPWFFYISFRIILRAQRRCRIFIFSVPRGSTRSARVFSPSYIWL